MLNRSSLTPIYPASLSDCLIQTDPLPKFYDVGAVAASSIRIASSLPADLIFGRDTCANPETYEAATRQSREVRFAAGTHGGWSEFFVSMFPAYQGQHQGRSFETA